ncbi:MAG TPA: ATP-dependent 6-phosphofructokinase [Deltaproteobacteria bacterium]|jgi:6-phosphofructokinase 1|nr:ATP-dependent 6-phosphofructokinase [Deltaproteobacteria bacterium]OQC29613.1 MAG: Pyrophosphate--fructose 6-phosphate 1-phosphotransferase [Deltaproteobacteria bacterium ADurb.Bin072]HRW79524.1 ATP-dependent 6-phosphofructokinase [Desulfomonilia bacterium]NMD40596.1 ATP-dependent 6-phosphofructokinase [Deltaproteobacteria bacterium]HNQ84557.1 ATP-dependent 6-phosphofructokinase [Deltaproteobacteria bacterium]
MRIAVLTGGGDCPGLNGAVKWVTKTALDPVLEERRAFKCDVLGIKDGWKGLVYVNPDDAESLAHHTIKLDEEVVRTWDRYGGTNLGTSRTNPFNPKKDRSDTVIENIRKLGIDVVVAIGGEDTLGVAYKLYRRGVKTVGIPKTIDSDLVGTEYSLGFDSAVNVIMEEIDRLRTTAGSHNRIFVVETMGRHAGWLALHGGECSGAYIILIPEHPFSLDRICELLQVRRGREVQYSIIVVSEGARLDGTQEFYKDEKVDEFGHRSLGGIAAFISDEIQKRTGFESRYVNLSHLQRGGSPSARDRLMARWFGIAAVDMIINEDYGRMVSYLHGEITSVPMKEVINRLRVVDVDKYYDTERYNGKRTIL